MAAKGRLHVPVGYDEQAAKAESLNDGAISKIIKDIGISHPTACDNFSIYEHVEEDPPFSVKLVTLRHLCDQLGIEMEQKADRIQKNTLRTESYCLCCSYK